jgi:hypothetical protein
MGILSPKYRILDTVITQEGKRQIASGEFKPTFYSFSDAGMFYKQDTIVSGAFDETYRFMFEAMTSPHDQITLEADDSGYVNAFPISGSSQFIIRQGQILSGTNRTPVSASQFASLAGELLSSSINNFQNLYILTSPDPLDLIEKQFLIGPTQVSFSITENKPINKNSELQSANVDLVESFFYDKRMSHIPNFSFLPPINKKQNNETEIKPLGSYVSLKQNPIDSFSELQKELDLVEKSGFAETVRFFESSRENNLFCQFFELANEKLTKFDIIDFGEFTVGEQTRHVFFAGKVFMDSTNSPTFVCLFTLVFQ